MANSNFQPQRRLLVLVTASAMLVSAGCIEDEDGESIPEDNITLPGDPDEGSDEEMVDHQVPEHITVLEREIDVSDTRINWLDGADINNQLVDNPPLSKNEGALTILPSADAHGSVLELYWDFEAPGMRFFNVHFRQGGYDDPESESVSLFDGDGFPINAEPDMQDHQAICLWGLDARMTCEAESPSSRHVGFEEIVDLGNVWSESGDTVALDVSLCRLTMDFGDDATQMKCNRYHVGDVTLQ